MPNPGVGSSRQPLASAGRMTGIRLWFSWQPARPGPWSRRQTSGASPRPGRFHRYLCRLEPRLTDLHFDPSDPFFRLVVRAHDLMHSLSTKTTP